MTNKTLYSLILLFSLIIVFLLFNLNLEKVKHNIVKQLFPLISY